MLNSAENCDHSFKYHDYYAHKCSSGSHAPETMRTSSGSRALDFRICSNNTSWVQARASWVHLAVSLNKIFFNI